MVFFTSDQHFGDDRILLQCNRPFRNTSEMREHMIRRWNDRVSDRDEIYILGDLFCYGYDDVEEILSMLKGIKHLVVGNHDKHWLPLIDPDKYFVSVRDFDYCRINGRMFVLSHYPMVDWYKAKYGSIQLYGHIHNEWRPEFDVLKHIRSFHVGVDTNQFTPLTADEIVEKLNHRIIS